MAESFGSGFVDGFRTGEAIKIARAERREKDYEFKRKQKDDLTKDRIDAGAAGGPKVGDEVAIDYDPTEQIRTAQSAIQPPVEQPGLLARVGGRLAHAIRPKDAAIGAGVAPIVPPNTVAGPTPPLGAQGIIPPGPQGPTPPTGALPLTGQGGADKLAGGDGSTEVEGVTAVAPKKQATRIYTMADEMQRHALNLRMAGAPAADQMAATKAWYEEAAKENTLLLTRGSASQITNALHKMGMDGDVTGNDEDGFKYVDSHGVETAYKSRDEMQAKLYGFMLRDPASGMKAVQDYNTQQRQERLAESQIKTNAAHAQAAIMNARNGAAQVKLLRDKFGFEVGNQQDAVQALQVLNDPDAPLLNPTGYAQAQSLASVLVPGSVRGQITTNTDGSTVQSIPNAYDSYRDSRVATYRTSPFVGAGVLRIYQDPKTGRAGFAVRDKAGKAMVYGSFDAAEVAARRIYGAPKTAATPTSSTARAAALGD